MHKVICYGEILWDNLPNGKVPGGAPMNIALTLQSLGISAAIISRLGKDVAGEELLEFLKQNNAFLNYIQTDNSLETGHVDIAVGGPEDLFFKIAKPVAWDNIELNDDLIAAVSKAKMFVFGSLAARTEASRNTLFELLKHANTKVFSVNLRSPHYTWDLIETLLKKSDIVKLTEYEYKDLMQWIGKGYYLMNEGLEHLRNKYNLDTICVTLGSKGAIMNRRGEIYEQPGYKVDIVDKVGAGNAFLAAYLKARADKAEPLDRLAFAIAAGAMATTYAGAFTQFTPEMILDFIKKNEVRTA
jgi:fructokinase